MLSMEIGTITFYLMFLSILVAFVSGMLVMKDN